MTFSSSVAFKEDPSCLQFVNFFECITTPAMDNFVKTLCSVGNSQSSTPLLAKRTIEHSTLRLLKLHKSFLISVYLEEYQQHFMVKCIDVEVNQERPEIPLPFLSYNSEDYTLYRLKKYADIFTVKELQESAKYLVRTFLKSEKGRNCWSKFVLRERNNILQNQIFNLPSQGIHKTSNSNLLRTTFVSTHNVELEKNETYKLYANEIRFDEIILLDGGNIYRRTKSNFKSAYDIGASEHYESSSLGKLNWAEEQHNTTVEQCEIFSCILNNESLQSDESISLNSGNIYRKTLPTFKSTYDIDTLKSKLDAIVTFHSKLNHHSVEFDELISLNGANFYRRTLPIYKSTYEIGPLRIYKESIITDETHNKTLERSAMFHSKLLSFPTQFDEFMSLYGANISRRTVPNFESTYLIGFLNNCEESVNLGESKLNDKSIYKIGDIMDNMEHEIHKIKLDESFKSNANSVKFNDVLLNDSIYCRTELNIKSTYEIGTTKIYDRSKKFDMEQFNSENETRKNEFRSGKNLHYILNDKYQFDEIISTKGEHIYNRSNRNFKSNYEFGPLRNFEMEQLESWIHDEIYPKMNIQNYKSSAYSLTPAYSYENVCNTEECMKNITVIRKSQSLENLKQLRYQLHMDNEMMSPCSSKESVDSGISLYETDKQYHCCSNMYKLYQDSVDETLEDEECYKWCTQLMVKKCIERIAYLYIAQENAKQLLQDIKVALEEFSVTSVQNACKFNKDFYRLILYVDESI